MKAALLSVGTELLFGQITNTNTVYLSQMLNSMGIDVLYHHTVGDNPARLKKMLELSFEDCDIVITTGGLGPTQDDITKEIVSQAMGDELVMHEDIYDEIKHRMLAYKDKVTENNARQAVMPSRCRIFHNSNGTAPGFALDRVKNPKGEKQWIVCLPGPPREMTQMFDKSVLPWLEAISGSAIVYREVRTFGIGESDLETLLMPFIDRQTDPTVATYAKNGETSVRVASKRESVHEAEEAVAEMIDRIRDVAGQYIYSVDGREYPQVVGELLIRRGLTISSAESCTGGMFAAALTDIPGISSIFDRSLVTYSNEAKMDELGVKAEILQKYGAVSRETAIEMAEGVKRVSGSDIGISVTGIAGPGGGTLQKPVGLVYIGLAYDGKTYCRKIDRTTNDRQRNRRNAVLSMFDVIYRHIIE